MGSEFRVQGVGCSLNVEGVFRPAGQRIRVQGLEFRVQIDGVGCSLDVEGVFCAARQRALRLLHRRHHLFNIRWPLNRQIMSRRVQRIKLRSPHFDETKSTQVALQKCVAAPRLRGGLVAKAHGLCASLNSKRESKKAVEEKVYQTVPLYRQRHSERYTGYIVTHHNRSF